MIARATYGVAIVIRIVTLIWASLHLPERIVTHFGASGAADGWGTRGGYIVFDIVISAALVLGLPMLVGLFLSGSGAAISIPNKDYWLRPENKPLLRERLMNDMLFFGGAIGLLLSWLDIEIVRANALDVPKTGVTTWVAIVLFTVATLGYSIWMAKHKYAIPAGQQA